MKQRFYGISLLVTVLAALALSGPARAGEQVPFKGTTSGAITVTGFSYPFVSFSSVAEGVATHLGRFTLTGQVMINVIIGGGTGVFTLTAANGDQLFLTLVAGPPVDPTHNAGDFTIVGGTGRFQGATGSYIDLITNAVPPGTADIIPYTSVFEGTISTPGSNK